MGSAELTSNIDLGSFAVAMELARASGAMSDVDMNLVHHFADGIYVRQLTIPAGTVIIGKKHKKECVNIMLKGDITIYADGDMERFTDHYIGVAPAGTQKAARAHKDTIWLCIHAVDNDNLEEIEKDIIIEDEKTNDILKKIRKHKELL